MFKMLVLTLLIPLTSIAETPSAYIVQNFPLLESLQVSGQPLSAGALEWMKKWRGLNLEETERFVFDELAGKSSVNLKLKLKDSTAKDGSKSRGSFVTRNSSANFDLEVAYFHMAALLGMDSLVRPSVPYQLGPKAILEFKTLIENNEITDPHRNENKLSILKKMELGAPLYGCLKAKSLDSELEYEEMGFDEKPVLTHPIFQALQATAPALRSDRSIELAPGYKGNLRTLAREYSVVLILDTIFQQWDRYSGGNISLSLDESGNAHFYLSDNGGGVVHEGVEWIEEYLTWFSRYDRKAIERLKELHFFLSNPDTGYYGYTHAEAFIQDLGLLTELPTEIYLEIIKRNIGMVLKKVDENEALYGTSIYLD